MWNFVWRMRRSAGQRPTNESERRGKQWVGSADKQYRSHRSAQRDGAVRGDIWKVENAKADEDAERQKCQDQPNRPSPDHKNHRDLAPFHRRGQGTHPARAARELALAYTDDRAVIVEQVQDRLKPLCLKEFRHDSA